MLKAEKPYADMYIDDRIPGGFPGWPYVKERVIELKKKLLEL